jgi:glycosyltransferase involved in cell wall biosynthesis
MKICLLTTSFPRYEGDYVGIWLLGLAQALAAEGAQITVVAPHEFSTLGHETIQGVNIRRFSYWWPKRAHRLCYGAGIPTNIRMHKWAALQFPLLEAGFFAAALRYGRRADVLNPHWTFAALPTVIAAKLASKAVITTAYSAEYIPKLLHPINRLVTRHSQAVLSISQYTHQKVEEVQPPRRHYVIPFGVNPEKIAPPDFDIQRFRSEQGMSADEWLIFAVGRLVERKGYRFLIDAVAELVRGGKPARLLLAGRGPDADQLQAQIDAAGLANRAALLGFVSDETLKLFLRASDVLVMPSIADKTGDTEGLGVPLLEAMANGTPVIGSNIGGIVDIVRHGQTGLLVEPENAAAIAEAIEQLMSDSSLRRQLIAEGYELVNGAFSWQAIAQRTISVFEEVANSR